MANAIKAVLLLILRRIPFDWILYLPMGFEQLYWKHDKPPVKKERPKPPADPFDPMQPLLWLSEQDPFCLTHAYEGVHIFGGNGSGKTSGPGAALIKAYMRRNFGGLILTAKPSEYDLIRKYAAETGRLDSLIRFAPDEKWRFNFLSYEAKRPSRGAGLTANIVKAF